MPSMKRILTAILVTLVITLDGYSWPRGPISDQTVAERAELIADTFADELTAYIDESQNTVYQDRIAASSDRLSELEAELNAVTFELARDPDSPTLQ